MHDRWQARQIRDALKTARVVILSGARQTGKTTLARTFAGANSSYRSLDRPSHLDSAVADPEGFVTDDARLTIIDEVQKEPRLIPAVKHSVDIDQREGRFLLVGSADLRTHPGIRESLAGRCWTVSLRPLAQGEILGGKPSFLERAFSMGFWEEEERKRPPEPEPGRERDRYLTLALSGGYPGAIRHPAGLGEEQWHRGYIADLLRSDLREILSIRRKKDMATLADRLAAWSSKEVDIAKLCRELAISRQTVESHINALETMLLVDRVPAWIDTGYERGKKRDKLFMVDSGLMAGILGWNLDDARFNADISGKLIGTHVHNQLAALVDARTLDYKLRPLPGPARPQGGLPDPEPLRRRAGDRSEDGRLDQGGRYQAPALVRGGAGAGPKVHRHRPAHGNPRAATGREHLVRADQLPVEMMAGAVRAVTPGMRPRGTGRSAPRRGGGHTTSPVARRGDRIAHAP